MAINKNTQLRNKIKRLEEENQELRNRLASFEQLKAFMVTNRHKLSRRYWNYDSFEHKLIDALYLYCSRINVPSEEIYKSIHSGNYTGN